MPCTLKCEFCEAVFQHRPQVKNPRACKNCQVERQRANEKTWHSKNKADFDSKYYRTKKIQRIKRIREIVNEFYRLITVGKTFLNQKLELAGFNDLLFQFLCSLGIRRVNKLLRDG